MQKHSKSLLLLRHAKSSWSDVRLKDFERPLNARGLVAAPIMAEHLSVHYPLPDLILCSTSQRTRETLASVMHFYRHPVKIIMTRDLYMASTLDVINVIKANADMESNVMVIGHNPSMEDTAFYLSGAGNEKSFRKMREKYPTASCAHLSFEIPTWHMLEADSGELETFVRPRDLMDEI